MNQNNLWSSEAEQSLLGAIFLNFKVMEDLTLNPEDFYNPKHEKMFRLMRRKFVNGEPIDQITFANDVMFAKIGIEVAYLYEITSVTPSASSAVYYAEIVQEFAVRRRLQNAGLKIVSDSRNEDFSYLIETAKQGIDEALGIKTSNVKFVGDEIGETLTSMTEPTKAYKTPWSLLTKAIGGFRAGSLYTIGARPGKGKTSIGLQCAMVLSQQGAVAFSSLEMRRQELHKRIISIGASIPMDSTMNNKMTDEDWSRVTRLRDQIEPNIAIDDRAEVSVHDIRAFARSVSKVAPLSGVVVDYLQLMSSKDNRPRHEIVAEMSRQLKILARDLEVPVIALSQLNRNSESRQDKRPTVADLRESGAIEQDSDVVILLHQEDDIMLLDVAKNRQGPPSIVRLKWQGEFARAVS